MQQGHKDGFCKSNLRCENTVNLLGAPHDWLLCKLR